MAYSRLGDGSEWGTFYSTDSGPTKGEQVFGVTTPKDSFNLTYADLKCSFKKCMTKVGGDKKLEKLACLFMEDVDTKFKVRRRLW